MSGSYYYHHPNLNFIGGVIKGVEVKELAQVFSDSK